jgi:hypothetical protein
VLPRLLLVFVFVFVFVFALLALPDAVGATNRPGSTPPATIALNTSVDVFPEAVCKAT